MKQDLSRRACLLALLGAPAAPAWAAGAAAAVQGVVTQVLDGATVRFTPAGQGAITVRVRDIDVPESCQPGATEAQAALAALVLNKPATLMAAGTSGTRTLGALVVDDVNVGRRMVEDGNAWSIRTRNDQGPLVKQERMAKALNRGLHAMPGMVPPREWRRTRPCPKTAG